MTIKLKFFEKKNRCLSKNKNKTETKKLNSFKKKHENSAQFAYDDLGWKKINNSENVQNIETKISKN